MPIIMVSIIYFILKILKIYKFIHNYNTSLYKIPFLFFRLLLSLSIDKNNKTKIINIRYLNAIMEGA